MPTLQDLYPLSPVQQGMLYHSLSSPDAGVYVNQLTLTLRGELDAGVFEGAWNDLVARHPILRTAFAWEGLERPLQVVHGQVDVPFRHEDLRDLPDREARRVVETESLRDRRRGFELDQAPLQRFILFRLSSDTHLLLWSHHHLLLDGWSLSLVLRDVFELYRGRCEGRPSSVPPPRPFKEYLDWLEDRRDAKASESFWRRFLSGFHEPIHLDVDPVPGVAESSGPGEHVRELPRPVSDGLGHLARRSRVTLNTVVQGAWAVLLSRYGGGEDLVYGMTVSGRPPQLDGVEDMVGMFINTVPMRVEVSAEDRLTEWLRELQRRQNAVREHEHSSLTDIQRWSDVPSGTPLFESLYVFENFPAAMDTRRLPGGLEVTEVDAVESTHYPLNLVPAPGERLRLRFLHDLERFDRLTIERAARHLEKLLAGMVENPETRLAELSLLTDAERRQIRDWNDTATPFDATATLGERFLQQARHRPDALAVEAGNVHLTYGGVSRRAARLARELAHRGIGRGDFVGVCLERSADMVPVLLGIARSGAAYVPLEASFPADRIGWILGDLDIRCLMTQTSLLETLASWNVGLEHVIVVDEPGRGESSPAVSAPSGQVLPEDIAYVIFTSGSTGRPKGVVVQHRAATHLIDWVNETFRVGLHDRLLFITSLSFDLSVYDVFGMLAAGGVVRVASSAELEDPERLVRILTGEQVTFWDSAPAALQRLVPLLPEELGSSRDSKALRLVFLSGDWIPVTLPDRLRASFPGADVISLGGATEATVWSNFHPTHRVDPQWVSIPYGRPIDNAWYRILGLELDDCPIGVAGDLYIGGVCLALGYSRPSLTADRFVPDPASAEPGGRLYRTGDRARFWHDGTMEFLGRLDHQVKIRGYRVELGEVERHLIDHPALRDVVALLRDDSPGAKQLVAYVVPRNPARVPAVEELRRRLEAKVPEYMVPSAFVVLDELPVTANGKLDRQALPAPADAKRSSGAPREMPRDEVERALAQVWAEVLQIDLPGIHDNFFELGGDSILSIQVIAKARREGLDLNPAEFFTHQTVAQQARAVGNRSPVEESQQRPTDPKTPDVELDEGEMDELLAELEIGDAS